MHINAAGLNLIREFESLRLEAYLCPAGKWTIGYGHTEGVTKGRRITEHQADTILCVDLDEFETDVAIVTEGLTLNENQFSALVSLSFNVGADLKVDGHVQGFGRDSALYKKLAAGDLEGAANEFLDWTHANGAELSGLVRRRAAERALFLQPAVS